MTEAKRYVVGVGAANVDVHGRSKRPLILRDSNPGAMHTSAGGVTRNILENAALLGVDTRLVSALGDDLFGDVLIRHCEQVGVDTSAVLRVSGARSSSYLSLLDDTGDMFVALSDMSILQNITPQALDERHELLRGAAAIVTDGCLPLATLRHLVYEVAKGVPVFVDPVSTTYAATVREVVGGFDTVKPNAMELEILSGIAVTDDVSLAAACRVLIEKGVRRVFVSLGREGCFYMDRAGNTRRVALRPVEHMVNATGAGDAFMGAIVYSYIQGLDINTTIQHALAAGITALLGDETINPQMSVEKLRETIEEREQ